MAGQYNLGISFYLNIIIAFLEIFVLAIVATCSLASILENKETGIYTAGNLEYFNVEGRISLTFENIFHNQCYF